MLGRTNISDEESEQVRGVRTDGSMELLITFMGTNTQPVLSDVFWKFHVETHLSCLGKITLAQHLGFGLKRYSLIEEQAKKLLGFQFCNEQLVNLLLCTVKCQGKDSALQLLQAGPGRGRGALGWIPGEMFVVQHHL